MYIHCMCACVLYRCDAQAVGRRKGKLIHDKLELPPELQDLMDEAASGEENPEAQECEQIGRQVRDMQREMKATHRQAMAAKAAKVHVTKL